MSVFSHKNRQKSGTILTTVQTQQREQVHQNMFEHQNQTEAPLFDKEGLAAAEDMAVIKFNRKKRR